MDLLGVGSPKKTQTSVDDNGMKKDLGNGSDSSIFTVVPFTTNEIVNMDEMTKSPILHVESIPLNWSFDITYEKFSKFGEIKDIRSRLADNYQSFEIWLNFINIKDAGRACYEFSLINSNMKCTLVDKLPRNVDIYIPPDKIEDVETTTEVVRSPHPPRWIIMTTRSERGNLFKVKKFLNMKLGHVKKPDVTRFGRNSFLVHAKSDGQAAMLLNLKLDTDCFIKVIKPHYNFSYARGVIFNEDVYELSDEEILVMCPERVWKIFKVPRSSMIILTFVNSDLPTEIIFDNEILRVRAYRPRVLQCFTCYGFGHASRVCTRNKICEHCSDPEHGECSRPKVCANCKGAHHARDKNCKVLKKEHEALLFSAAEHVSIGHAKKLLAKRNTYSDVVLGSLGGASKTSSAGASQAASSGGASRPSSGGASGPSSGGTSQASSGGASRASLGGASRASSGGAPRASSGGAPRASSGGAPRASDGAHKKTNSEVSKASSKTPQDLSPDTDIQSEPQDTVVSGTRPGSINELDKFFIPESLPGCESLPDVDIGLPMVTVHRSNSNEEMEALTVGQKRARTPSSPHSSSRASSHEKNRKENSRSVEDQLPKKLSSERNSRSKNKEKISLNKISLSRPVISKPGQPNKIPKSK